MDSTDIIVIGSGISGLSFAYHAARSGRRVQVLEQREHSGGCLHSHRRPDGFWFELGAHTVYNSYCSWLELVLGTGLADRVVQRGPARAHFGLLRGSEVTWLTPPRVLLRLGWLEAAWHFPRAFFRSKEGQSVSSYYSRLIGPKNFGKILSPFFAAVPSQSADGFPVSGAGSLFKTRSRNQDFPRSYGFPGGLQTVTDALARMEGLTLQTGVQALRVERRPAGLAVITADGRTLEAPLVAVATPPDAAATLLQQEYGELSAALGRIRTVGVESLGVVLPRERCWMPPCAFVVPVDDVFYSAVTRDPFPHEQQRAFAFHFRPGLTREQQLQRMSEVLRLPPEELEQAGPIGQQLTLPSPALGHAARVAEIDRALAGHPGLALTGNYFAGLAIEDCVLRSAAEWARLA